MTTPTPIPTPRTDAYLRPPLALPTAMGFVPADFARTLEQELSEALDANKRANSLIGAQAQANDKLVNQLNDKLTQWRKVAEELAQDLYDRTQLKLESLTTFNNLKESDK